MTICHGKESKGWTLLPTSSYSLARAGLGVRGLVDLLEAGMSNGQLAEYLVAKLTEKPLEN